MAWKPADADNYERMLTLMRHAETKEELKAAALLFIFDLTYARSDIAMALHVVEREKGFRA